MVSSFKRLYEMHPVARGLSLEDHCRLLMGGVLPRETENTTVDRYLIAIPKLRLGFLTEQGEGACSFFMVFLHLFVYLVVLLSRLPLTC